MFQGSGKSIAEASRKRFRSDALGSHDDSPSIRVFRSHPRSNRQKRKQRRYTSGFDPSESDPTPSHTSSEDSASDYDDFDLDSSSTDDSTSTSDTSSFDSGSDVEWNADAEQPPSTYSIEQPSDRVKVIYFSASSALTARQFSKIRKALRTDAPNAKVMLETAKATRRASYSSRETLNHLMDEVFNGNVSEISVADSTHICSTKDGFQLFGWICGQFGTKVLISRELQML
jgi:hypothetical protein